MSIFGNLDAAEIPSNPYYVEEGEYEAEVTDAKYKTNNKEQRQLVIEYTITDDSSQYQDSKVFQYFTLVDPEMTREQLELLPAEEQRSIRKTMSALKRTLCGNEANSSQKGLGVSVDDLNDANWQPTSLVNTKVNIGVNNYGADKQGVNVRWVNLAQ